MLRVDQVRRPADKKFMNNYNKFAFIPECDPCPCVNLPPSFKSALSSMIDVSLLKDPAFMFIGISNVFGMAALYVPFVYLVDFAVQTVVI